MAVTAKITGLADARKKLQALHGVVADAGVSYVVGYTQAYAVYVHERLDVNHPNGGQAKFLEEPARALKKEYGRIVKAMVGAGKTVAQAVLACALRLQAESQKLVPVDTGALRASAFTKRGK